MPGDKKKVFIGLNINLDAKINIKSNDDFQKMVGYLEKYHPEMKDTFVNCVRNASAREELVCAEFMETCIENFPYEFVLGGQEGFFLQNCATSFRDKVDVVLHLPCHAKQLIDFVKGILPEAYAYDATGKLVQVSTLEPSDESAPIHIIAEYPADLELCTPDGEKFTTGRANRFILTYDEVNSILRFDAPYVAQLRESSGPLDAVCLISGFHLLSDATLDATVEARSIELFELTRKRYKYVHYEVASNDCPKVFALMQKVFPYVDSIGVNEAELDLLGSHYVAGWAEAKEKVGYVTLVTMLMEAIKIDAVYFHTAGLYISVVRKDAKTRPTKEALLHGFETAENVIIRTRSVEGTKTLEMPLPERTTPELENATSSFPTFEICSHRPKMIKPISSTVGLGDTISSSIVLGAFTF